jgi:hypothetical protein
VNLLRGLQRGNFCWTATLVLCGFFFIDAVRRFGEWVEEEGMGRKGRREYEIVLLDAFS